MVLSDAQESLKILLALLSTDGFVKTEGCDVDESVPCLGNFAHLGIYAPQYHEHFEAYQVVEVRPVDASLQREFFKVVWSIPKYRVLLVTLMDILVEPIRLLQVVSCVLGLDKGI